MRCPQCGNYLSKHASACDCGWERGALTATKAATTIFAHRFSEENIKREKLRTAEYECKHFSLCPQSPSESDEDFCRRINREKTPKVIAKNMETAAQRACLRGGA